MEKEEEKKTPKPRGGYREGAGRKPKDHVATQLMTVSIRKDWIEIINKHYDNRSDFVQHAIREKLRRERLI